MKEQLHINGQVFHLVRVAAECVPYSKDYITRLAREKKIKAVYIARKWYVDRDGLMQYEQVQKIEVASRNRQLKMQRKIEHTLRDALVVTERSYGMRHATFAASSFIVLLLIVTAGFVSGIHLNGLLPASVFLGHASHVTPNPEHDELVLTPVFVPAGEQSVVVENGRSFSTPDAAYNWLRIHYE